MPAGWSEKPGDRFLMGISEKAYHRSARTYLENRTELEERRGGTRFENPSIMSLKRMVA